MHILWVVFLLAFLPQNAFAKHDRQPYGGTLVWGVSHKPDSINPILTTQGVSVSLASLIFNSLVRWNSKGEIEPDLAERWEVSSDGLVYTFYLRKGILFHDGIECTSRDVKFTFDTLIAPEINSPYRPLFDSVKEFKAPDIFTFQVVLSKPSPFFIYRAIREIVPEHILKGSDLKTHPFNLHPVGTGPFRFKAWTKDNRIILEYNPDYYEGRPYLDNIVVRVFKDSLGVWAAMMRQETDLALFLEKEDYEVMKDDPTFKTYAFALDGYYAIVYNLDDAILQDKRIRYALAHSIDTKWLIKKVSSGYGLECFGPFHPDSSGFNPDVKPLGFNPDKAIELLSEAGWHLNKDGIMQKGDEGLELRMLVDKRSNAYRKMALLIRQQLQELGIKLKVQWYDDNSILTEEFLEKNKPSAQLRWLLAGITPDQVEWEWRPHERERVQRLWLYNNPEMEKYFDLGKTTQDKQKREEIYQGIHRVIYEDQPVCFLYFPFCFHSVSSRFENVSGFFNLTMPVHSLREWSLAKK